jgi:ATP-binding cassette subfamily F protein 3
LRLENASIAYGDKTVLSHLNLSIGPEDRIAILGPNGAGKSSLIKLLAGDIAPATGIRETSAGVKIGYFAQHQVDHLQLNETPLTHLKKIAPTSSEQELRTYLGTFGFLGNTVYDQVKIFSGGEKSRLALALLVWKKPNLLLLDEPTNHLDLEMRNSLSIALQEYQGAMLIVSHDRFLVRTSADQLALVANGEMNNFTGDLNDYEKWLFEFRRQSLPASGKSEVSKKAQRQLDAKERELRRPLEQKIKALDAKLEKLQKELTENENALTDNTLYEPQHKERLQRYLLSQATLKKELQLTEDAWLLACAERDNFNS